MNFDEILGLEHIKHHLVNSIENRRVAHAQLFVGEHGYGTLPMALAYARLLIENSQKNSLKVNVLEHPDVHFVYPINSVSKSSKKPLSKDLLPQWRDFIQVSPYGNLFDWYKHIGIEKKQGLINVDEASQISKDLSLKAFNGGAKVMIIWCAYRLNTQAANKLLKLIEEPPQNTFFILITNQEDQILDTIKSRCQRLNFPPLSEADISSALQQNFNVEATKASSIAHQADGDYTAAIHLLQQSDDEQRFETLFIRWVRSAFRAKGYKYVVKDLIDWSDELASENRETQKRFLQYCIQFFRQALLFNYDAKDLVYLKVDDPKFKFSGFAQFIGGHNINDLFKALEDALYYVERNGSGKMIFTDLSFELTRLLHKKK